MLIEFVASSALSQASSDWNGDLRPDDDCFDAFDLQANCRSQSRT